MAKRIFTGKQLDYSNFQKSGAMKELMKNPKIARVLDEHREQKAFYDTLRKNSDSGGTSKDEFRKTLGELYKKSGIISHHEVEEIGRAMGETLGEKRITISGKEKKVDADSGKKAGDDVNSRDFKKVSANSSRINSTGNVSGKEQQTSGNHAQINKTAYPASRLAAKGPSESALELIRKIQDK